MTSTETPRQSLSILTMLQIGELLGDICAELTQRAEASKRPPARHGSLMTRLDTSTPAQVGGQVRNMTFYGIREEKPGMRWKSLFEATWGPYRAWYASEGLDRRPDLRSCRRALKQHMPELVPTWERLVALTEDDEAAARMLSLWDPPAFAPGCAQLVIKKPQRLLIRNYDYSPELFEQVVYSSRFTHRRVIGTADCLWGLLDGMNDDALETCNV